MRDREIDLALVGSLEGALFVVDHPAERDQSCEGQPEEREVWRQPNIRREHGERMAGHTGADEEFDVNECSFLVPRRAGHAQSLAPVACPTGVQTAALLGLLTCDRVAPPARRVAGQRRPVGLVAAKNEALPFGAVRTDGAWLAVPVPQRSQDRPTFVAKPSLKLYINDREVRHSRIRLFGVGWMIIGLGGLLLMMLT